MKLTDNYPWGVMDTETGEIVARSSEGYLAVDKARALNRKTGSGVMRPSNRFDGRGNRIWEKDLSDRYTVVNNF